MRALVVFESMYGNTKEVAAAVADGLSTHLRVDLVEVGTAPNAIDEDIVLLVVGGPTHAHGMSKPDSRHSAAQRDRESPVPFRIGIREWLADLHAVRGDVTAAAFDTRIKGPSLLWGSAAQGAAKELRRLGFREAVSPESFLVKGPLGPVRAALVDGETERARAWGMELGSKVGARA
jgi:hypothetical protein